MYVYSVSLFPALEIQPGLYDYYVCAIIVAQGCHL